MLVDRLENEGVVCKESYKRYVWDSTPLGNLREDSQRQADKDMEKFHTIKSEQEEKLVEARDSRVVSLT